MQSSEAILPNVQLDKEKEPPSPQLRRLFVFVFGSMALSTSPLALISARQRLSVLRFGGSKKTRYAQCFESNKNCPPNHTATKRNVISKSVCFLIIFYISTNSWFSALIVIGIKLRYRANTSSHNIPLYLGISTVIAT